MCFFRFSRPGSLYLGLRRNIWILGTRNLREVLKSEEGLKEMAREIRNESAINGQNGQSSHRTPMKRTNSYETEGKLEEYWLRIFKRTTNICEEGCNTNPRARKNGTFFGL
jgi:hypothetical protein